MAAAYRAAGGAWSSYAAPDGGIGRGRKAEADCAFYVGEKAEAYIRAEALGDEQADAFTDHHPPDLVVEINVSHTDEGKPAWYRRLGVTELWAVAGGKSPDRIEVEFLDLQASDGPAASRESKVIPEHSLPTSRTGCECSRTHRYR